MNREELLLKKIDRLVEARKAAEAILESKSLELWESKQQLELKVQQRTLDLQKEKEKAQKAQKAEKLFLANMSHEIRTPLNAIVGMIHLLKETQLEEQQSKYVDTLKNSALILQNLISDILDFSKIDAGKIEAINEIVDLKILTEDLMTIFKSHAKAKGVDLHLSIDNSINSIVFLDPKLIHQVLINLIGNALKFTEKGHVSLTLNQLKTDNSHQTIRFSVNDTGIGIARDKLDSIFQDFTQAENNTDRIYGGTGLGLAISKKIVNILGGTLRVTSQELKGSSFYFDLELQIGKRKSETVETKNSSEIKLNSNLKILIAEDNLMNQMYAQALLEKWSIDCELANNGIEALDLAKNKKYSLILMDCQMPIMDGYEATKTLRLYDKETPIIALTASSMREDKEAALQQGFTDFMTKPYTPNQLKEMIHKHSHS